MRDHKYGLFFKRRFLPIFLAQFLGALNDNLLRSGLVVMIAYAGKRGITLPMEKEEVLVTICSALLVVPFILFSYLSGQIADKTEKARLVTITKIAEVGIMVVAAYGFAAENIYVLMAMLFVSGTHSTFFSPIKYSILPEHLRPGELLAGNGFISGGTYLGILAGLISGGLLVELTGNVIGYAAVGIALAGLAASLFIPRSAPAAPHIEVNFHLIHGTMEMIRQARKSPAAFHAIMALSWFLLIGSVYMAQFANYAGKVVGADNEVYTLFLSVFSVGIALGSVLCDKLLKGEVTARFAPRALLGVSLFTLLMVFFTPRATHDHLLTVSEFLSDPSHIPLLLSMMMVAVSGGIYMVPMYAMLQTKTEPHFRSQVIAASNMFDSLFMTGAAVVCVALLWAGFAITDLFVLVAVLNLLVFLYARKVVARYAEPAA